MYGPSILDDSLGKLSGGLGSMLLYPAMENNSCMAFNEPQKWALSQGSGV
jgi:hypothetical protein